MSGDREAVGPGEAWNGMYSIPASGPIPIPLQAPEWACDVIILHIHLLSLWSLVVQVIRLYVADLRERLGF